MAEILEVVLLEHVLQGDLQDVLGNMFIVIVCKPGCDVLNFEVSLIYIIIPFFLHEQKDMTKTYIS